MIIYRHHKDSFEKMMREIAHVFPEKMNPRPDDWTEQDEQDWIMSHFI